MDTPSTTIEAEIVKSAEIFAERVVARVALRASYQEIYSLAVEAFIFHAKEQFERGRECERNLSGSVEINPGGIVPADIVGDIVPQKMISR